MEIVNLFGGSFGETLLESLAASLDVGLEPFVNVAILAPVGHLGLVVKFDFGNQQPGEAFGIFVRLLVFLAKLRRSEERRVGKECRL